MGRRRKPPTTPIERHLDAERLVEGEDDIEEIEAADANLAANDRRRLVAMMRRLIAAGTGGAGGNGG